MNVHKTDMQKDAEDIKNMELIKGAEKTLATASSERTENTETAAFAYEIRKEEVIIWRCFSRFGMVQIPERIEGYPVTELAPYAFSAHMEREEWKSRIFSGICGKLPEFCGAQVENVVLPDSLRKVGRYCFYNCENLKSLSFGGGLKDWGSGTFTGCHRIQKLTFRAGTESDVALREVLQEVHEEVELQYETGKGDEFLKALLYFPEFFEEGVENTPARLLITQVHGSGLYYRNCFRQRQFDFQEYDERFPYAQAQERADVLFSMATARLRFPIHLQEKARNRYEKCLLGSLPEFADWVIRKRDLSLLRWSLQGEDTLFSKNSEIREKLLNLMTEAAGTYGYLEEVSELMECRRRLYAGRKEKKMRIRKFEL